MKTLSNIDFNKKRALIRVDFNVPLNDKLRVTDASRIEAAKPTILKIIEGGGSAVLMSHLGRPNGKEEKFSLRNIVEEVARVLDRPVKFIDDCVGEKVEAAAKNLPPGEVLLLENLRFHPEEKAGDEAFTKNLAKLGDVYVNDAFGTAHRAHASTTVVAKYFQEKCFGKLLAKEIESLNKVLKHSKKPVAAVFAARFGGCFRVLKHSKKPVAAVLGGAKVSTKITVIENILPKIDHLIIGGGMVFTFIKAQGGKVGNSLVENDKLDLALQILEKATAKNVTVHLPVDVVIADKFSAEANTKTAPVDQIPEAWMGLDIGPKTRENFHEVLLKSKTILWNGPMGVFELNPFSKGTLSLGKSIAESTQNGAYSLVGGGDSVAAVKKFGLENRVSYVSTGGGALLEMLEGKTLPGIVAIMEK